MSVKENIVGFVFARGGSKGVKNKNIRLLGGKPLIGHAIEKALGSKYLSRVVVSTDCPQIATVARQFGAEVPFMRPPELASDTAEERLAWRHAIEQVEQLDGRRIDVFVSTPPTCPLRESEDIDRCIEALLACDGDIMLTATDTGCNPYFNMVTIDDDGTADLASRPDGRIMRRQDAPKVYELTALAYAVRRESVFQHNYIFASDSRAIEVPAERAIDIDNEFDLELAEFLYQRRQKNSPRLAA